MTNKGDLLVTRSKKIAQTINDFVALKAELLEAAIAFAKAERGVRSMPQRNRPVDVITARERLEAAARAVEANGR